MGQAAKETGPGEVLGAMPTGESGDGGLRAQPDESCMESCNWGSGPPRGMWPSPLRRRVVQVWKREGAPVVPSS